MALLYQRCHALQVLHAVIAATFACPMAFVIILIHKLIQAPSVLTTLVHALTRPTRILTVPNGVVSRTDLNWSVALTDDDFLSKAILYPM